VKSASSPDRGWYPDPAHPAQERFWSGSAWSKVVRKSPPRDPALLFPLASWWSRCGAGIVDTIIAWILTGVVLNLSVPDLVTGWNKLATTYRAEFMEGARLGRFVEPPQALAEASMTVVLVLGVITAFYSIIMLGVRGATVGHRLMGVKVIKAPLPMRWLSLAGYPRFVEEKPGWMRSISKGLGWALFSTGTSWFALVQIVNVLLPLWHPRKQSVTDVFASTLLVRDIPQPTQEGSHA